MAPIQDFAIYNKAISELSLTECSKQAFENTSTSIAASQMRNHLNKLSDTVSDEQEKKVWPRHPQLMFSY